MLNSHGVEYLLIGGWAVGLYGYARATADMDVWIARHEDNAERMVAALREYGFGVEELRPELFLREGALVRMGLPPLRIQVLTRLSGVDFGDCYAGREQMLLGEVLVPVISLGDLCANKRAAGRAKDLDDLDHLAPR